MGTLSFCPHSKVGVEETAKYTTQHFDFKQNLQVGPRVEAQELNGEGAGGGSITPKAPYVNCRLLTSDGDGG